MGLDPHSRTVAAGVGIHARNKLGMCEWGVYMCMWL
jgi:hypothetical protein